MKIHVDAPSEEVQIQIIPLIDVIFCILTFFILAALQFNHQQAIKVDLPKATTATPLPGVGSAGNTQFREMVVVTISLAGQIYLDQKLVDRTQLAQDLQLYVQQNPNGLLVLNASPNAFYNDVIQVLDDAIGGRGDRVALATSPTTPQSPGASPAPGTTPTPSTSPSFNPFDPFNNSTPRSNSAPSATPSPFSTPFDPFNSGGSSPSKTPGQ